MVLNLLSEEALEFSRLNLKHSRALPLKLCCLVVLKLSSPSSSQDHRVHRRRSANSSTTGLYSLEGLDAALFLSQFKMLPRLKIFTGKPRVILALSCVSDGLQMIDAVLTCKMKSKRDENSSIMRKSTLTSQKDSEE
ncbi:60S ribosomal protein L24-like isoform X2 [Glycine max]|uniref:60S ribosomal protein L24-like isoform X2 n=1 Tax=Glycine max TaxID=3847 RepID=UPI0003DE75B9|nr:uncharacterized protein LOC100499979 isoform X2 [Glycine max]